jgi:hypothetical protein
MLDHALTVLDSVHRASKVRRSWSIRADRRPPVVQDSTALPVVELYVEAKRSQERPRCSGKAALEEIEREAATW